MFLSAKLKLTAWYLLIIMAISVVFSFAIYNIASNELDIRLINLENNLQSGDRPYLPDLQANQFRLGESREASSNILFGLVYANILILVVGGSISYLMARKVLKPIQVSHEMQSRFTSDASHELRTPLAAMKTEIEVAVKDKNLDIKGARQILSSNLEEVNKLTKLSEMLLNLSMLDNEKLEMKKVSLNEILLQAVGHYKQSANRLKIQSKNINVLGNETALSELVSILIDNALKYSYKNSVITVTSSVVDDFGSIEITNTGDGINEDELLLIFNRFYRSDASRSGGDKKGYGLGLSIAKKIVELHSGELDVTSTPGGTTVFTVLLPLVKKSPSKS